MKRPVMWTVLAFLSVIYLVVVAWAVGTGATLDLASIIWMVLIVPSMVMGGVFLVIRRPDNNTGVLLLWAGLTMFMIPTIFELPTSAGFANGGARDWMWAPMWMATTLTSVGFVLLMTLVVLLPDGRFRYRRERRFIAISWVSVLLPTVALVSNETVYTHAQAFPGVSGVKSPFVIDGLVAWGETFVSVFTTSYLLFFGALVLQFMRYRRAPMAERKQVRWVLYGGMSAVVLGVIPFTLAELGLIEPIGHTALSGLLTLIPAILFMGSVIVAVIEPPWVDVDIVIRKSFVYGALSFLILLLYVAVAAALGVAAGARLEIEVAVILTVVIAIVFQPARRRLQTVADRWVFGESPSKYEAVTEFTESIEQTSDPSELLPQLVETIQTALRLKWVRADLDDGSSAETGRVAGEPAHTARIGLGAEEVGLIECGPKREGTFDEDETHLVNTLAGQVGLAIMNARLAGRIVNAAEAERRRIERNIHDGAQQELVALVARLGMARSSASRGELKPREIAEMQNEARRILVDLRELAQGIHPSVLSDGGILEAVEDRCSRLPIDVSVKATPGLRSERFGDDIEGAAYFFVTETLTNVMKHAGATYADVSLTHQNGHMLLSVTDDGRGFDPPSTKQHGLEGLRDRITALGGSLTISSRPDRGTEISALLPVA